MKPAHLIEELEWQLALGQGTHQAMTATGYTNPATLARWLNRHGRNDLAQHFQPTTGHHRKKDTP